MKLQRSPQGPKQIMSMRFTIKSVDANSSLESEYTLSIRHIFALTYDVMVHLAVMFQSAALDQQLSFRNVLLSAPSGSLILFQPGHL